MPASDPLRLALVITELHPGGAERCLVELATRIDRKRFSPVVSSLWPRPPENRRLLLDTVSRLTAAVSLYQSLGFVEIDAYRHNPLDDARYFALDLRR